MAKIPSKTDCSRFLCDYGETVAELSKYWKEYMLACKKGGKTRTNHFGFWLREMHLERFDRFYKSFFIKHPELLDVVYANCESSDQ